MNWKNWIAPKVLLTRDGTALSKVIQWWTDGKASHALLYFPYSELAWEAVPGGVRARKIENWDGVEAFDVFIMSCYGWRQAERFCLDHVGDGYDFLGILRRAVRANNPPNGRWVCSSFVFSAIQAGGVTLQERVPFWKISPEDLRRSPLLIPAK
jgi:hypothetical protein